MGLKVRTKQQAVAAYHKPVQCNELVGDHGCRDDHIRRAREIALACPYRSG